MTADHRNSEARSRGARMLRTALIALLLFNAVALGVTYNFDVPYWTFIILVGLQLAFTVALHMFAVQAPKPAYVAPLFPVGRGCGRERGGRHDAEAGWARGVCV